MGKYNKGDLAFHKSTHKRVVIKGPAIKGGLLVTTEDDETRVYEPEELWTEEEWNSMNANDI